MKQRGRKSSASLSVVAAIPNYRPEPPPELGPEEAAVWRFTVAAMRPDWFGGETHPLLAQYCRHVVIARTLANAITATTAKSDMVMLDRLNRLLAMQARETAAIAKLATRMRMTQQATRNSKTVANVNPGPKPWERG
jgi:hypothetical protein